MYSTTFQSKSVNSKICDSCIIQSDNINQKSDSVRLRNNEQETVYHY